MKLYSVRDVMNGFMAPISLSNDNVAIRFFKLQVCQKSDIPASDMELWKIAEMDEDNGMISQDKNPVKLYSGKDVLSGEVSNAI